MPLGMGIGGGSAQEASTCASGKEGGLPAIQSELITSAPQQACF